MVLLKTKNTDLVSNAMMRNAARYGGSIRVGAADGRGMRTHGQPVKFVYPDGRENTQ